MENQHGEQLPLLYLAEHSLANPALRRGEFMARINGFEQIAAGRGDVAEFITLTCPSRFHAELAAGGRNPQYARATAREAQAWLCGAWARVRAALRRLSMLIYGVRVAEPHHDGCPHWHMVIFARAADVDRLRFIVRQYWLSDAGDEPGAADRRVTFATIDPAKGSATGYVAKYVAKNIDAAGSIGEAISDETGAPVSQNVERVPAWSATYGIRQFQQIGGPPVGLYREFRRLRNPLEDHDLEAVRQAADAGRWADFVRNCGGILVGRKTNPRLERHPDGRPNRYGEPRADRIIGVRYASALELTRPNEWRIEYARGYDEKRLTCVPIDAESDGRLGGMAWTSARNRGPRMDCDSERGGFLQVSAELGAHGRGHDQRNGDIGAAGRGSASLNAGSSSYLGPVAITVRAGLEAPVVADALEIMRELGNHEYNSREGP